MAAKSRENVIDFKDSFYHGVSCFLMLFHTVYFFKIGSVTPYTLIKSGTLLRIFTAQRYILFFENRIISNRFFYFFKEILMPQAAFLFFNMRSALPLLQSVATKRIFINLFFRIRVYSCVFMFFLSQHEWPEIYTNGH